MIKHVWSVLCTRAIIDEESKNVSIFNVLEHLTVSDLPQPDLVIPIAIEVVSLWVREDVDVPAKGSARLALFGPDRQQLAMLEQELNLSQHERLRTRLQFRGFPAVKEGRFVFQMVARLSKDETWATVAEIPLMVTSSPPAPEQDRATEGEPASG